MDAIPFGELQPSLLAQLAWKLATLRHVPSTRKFIRKKFARHYPGPFDVAAEGLNFRVWPAENHSDRTIMGRRRLPEENERCLIGALIKPDMVFVDIGANIGLYSLFIAGHTGGRAQIIALEPHPKTFAKLQFNCRANNFEHITALNVAAGATKGEDTLFFDGGGNIGGASMLTAAAGGSVEIAIQTDTLPSILTGTGTARVDLLKADIEGYEDRALMPLIGNDKWRDLWPEAILLETVHRKLWQQDLVAILISAGYAIIGTTEENLLFQRFTKD